MTRRIHIIDDDVFTQNLLRTALSARGFTITVSSDAYSIFDLEDNFPDLFVIDVVLPGLNGLETCKWIKEKSQDTPVIILSATPGLRVLAQDAHANDYLEKPFDIAALVRKINRLLREATAGTTH